MRLKLYFGLTLAVFFACAAYSALAQAVPTATEPKLPLAVGAGFSAYNPDWEHGHLLGGTLWIDYTPTRVPWFLNGIGIEAEARDLNYGRSSSQDPNLRLDTAGGGLIYSYPHFHNFRPYVKVLKEYGNIDLEYVKGVPSRDSRLFTCWGGGAEFRASRNIWVRAEYEYQSWPHMVTRGSNDSAPMHPQGFTLGALYHFHLGHSHSN